MSVLAALVAGTLGLLAGYTLERFRRSSTDRRWLLDRRHDDAITYLGALNAVAREVARERPVTDHTDATRAAEEALFATRITSSAEVDRLNLLAWDALGELVDARTQSERDERRATFVKQIKAVMQQLRIELQEGGRPRFRGHRRSQLSPP